MISRMTSNLPFRPATPADQGRIEEFLHHYVTTSMFPLTNLRNYGFASPAPRAMRFWVQGQGDIQGAFGLSNSGMMMPQMPDAQEHDWQQVADICRAEALMGAIGEAGQVRTLLQALGLATVKTNLNEDEPGFQLNLDDLTVPSHENARFSPITAQDDFLFGWRAAYHHEVLGTPDGKADAEAQRDIENYLKTDNYRVLRIQNEPVCLTGFNAVLPEIVQIGGVYVPPALRRKGFARLAVALHLQEARESGVIQACLFAISDAAARAYQAIGFRPAGKIALVLFEQEETPT